jgi:exonuclease VII large subunit
MSEKQKEIEKEKERRQEEQDQFKSREDKLQDDLRVQAALTSVLQKDLETANLKIDSLISDLDHEKDKLSAAEEELKVSSPQNTPQRKYSCLSTTVRQRTN